MTYDSVCPRVTEAERIIDLPAKGEPGTLTAQFAFAGHDDECRAEFASTGYVPFLIAVSPSEWSKALPFIRTFQAKTCIFRKEQAASRSCRLHDRDLNAAGNILAAGIAATVLGGAVRPGRKRFGGRLLMQEDPEGASPRRSGRRRVWDHCSYAESWSGWSVRNTIQSLSRYATARNPRLMRMV